MICGQCYKKSLINKKVILVAKKDHTTQYNCIKIDQDPPTLYGIKLSKIPSVVGDTYVCDKNHLFEIISFA